MDKTSQRSAKRMQALLKEMYELIRVGNVSFGGRLGGGIWTWPDRALYECDRKRWQKNMEDQSHG